ncbi:MAG TPA: GNAT family N-acetyltransferase [Tenuifilaceae bacterium]|nr:GNAT family N-acetyltransferase [Tenuifilaceae bacterium]HPQ33396.1 GNAT family N-acetyltransferase [Tenuifilaceae bacterium]
MQVQKTDRLPDEYSSIVERFYGTSEAVSRYIDDSLKGYEKIEAGKQKATFFVATEKEKLLGIVSLIPTETDLAFFGFFECENELVCQKLWNSVLDEAKMLGVKTLVGPVNGTIWHPYRFVSSSNGEPFFPTEPITRIEYSQWFSKLSYSKMLEYHSAYRTDFTPILESTRKSFNTLQGNGYKFSVEDVNSENVQELYQLAVEVFSKNPGYTHLSINEFVSLYSSEKLSQSSSQLYTARHEGKLVGFCLNLAFGNELVMKTIAVSNEFQLMGIGNALVHKVHLDAVERGVSKVIYGLVRKDNNVKYFPTDKLTVFREYVAYIFNI